MEMNNAIKTKQLGQSIWYDNIDREDLENGKMIELVQQGKVYGVTSNPSIFEKSIGSGNIYDLCLQSMAWAGLDTQQIYFELVKQDIQMTADIFRDVYTYTEKVDGYVSVEIDPTLADDTQKSIQEGKNLWAQINRRNVMIKVPATLAGIPVIRALIAEGINVNATLIFSIDRYRDVMEAYLLGIEDRLKKGLDVSHIHSVASFFVSRIDTAVDKLLDEKIASGSVEANELKGKIAIDNARMAYQEFKQVFSSPRFEALAKHGAQIQRPLWASTGTKNPNYSDCLYVDELIGPNTVNTIPTKTLHAFLDHGKVEQRITHDLGNSIKHLDMLLDLDIDLTSVTDKLEADGVLAFQKAHESLLDVIEKKRSIFAAEIESISENLKDAMKYSTDKNFIQRLFDNDPTLWTDDASQYEEIRNRLGWLSLPAKQYDLVPEYDQFLEQILQDGFTDVFVLGMGGSSLAPEVLAQSFETYLETDKRLRLQIIDTTNPIEIKARCETVNLEKTLFIVASKSGGTSETMAAYKYFSNEIAKISPKDFGRQFVAITDPGSPLVELAKKDGFRAVFYAPANVGGRFSAFTPFGLVPASLIGLDLENLLNKAKFSDRLSQKSIAMAANPNAILGLAIGSAAKAGRNKLTFIAESFAANLVPWLEQLIAESSGKDGVGILPVENEPELHSYDYPNDRLFIYFEVDGSKTEMIDAIRQKGLPVLTFKLSNPYDLAREFYRWEYATAIACAYLRVNAFNQPDVQSNKLVTKAVIEKYKETGQLDEGKAIFCNNQVEVYGEALAGLERCNSLDDVIHLYAQGLEEGAYIAINAFLPRLPEEIEKFQALRSSLLNKYNVATTLGFGPRFLHSTGQLHKGGPGEGVLYLIFTRKNAIDIEIPGEGMSFGTLQLAQALGDFDVLKDLGKNVIRIDLQDYGENK